MNKLRHVLNYDLRNLISPAIISFLMMVPFIILELVNRYSFHQPFPYPLFGMLWLLPTIFIAIQAPLVQKLRDGEIMVKEPILALLSVAILALISVVYLGILIDQLPCFLGVLNCD